MKDSVNYVLQNDELQLNQTYITKNNYLGTLSMATEGMSNNKDKIDFSDATFITIISDYNKSIHSENVIYNSNKQKSVHFQIVYGGVGKGIDANVIFFKGLNRMFLPNISRTTSLNFGFVYYYEKYNEDFNDKNKYNKYDYRFADKDPSVTRQIFSVPLLFQQSISNGRFRPYIFGGFCFTYKRETSEIDINLMFNDAYYEPKNFGINVSYGAGLEVDVIKGILLKAEYETGFYQYYLAGLGYRF